MTTDLGMETANYRYYRRMAWQVVRSRYAAAVADELEASTPEAEARKAAARPLRGEVRALMSELLTHAPVPAVLAFLQAAQEWGDAGERLLEQGDAVLALTATIEPRPPWRGPGPLPREAAEDDARWSAWVQAWLMAFKATGPEAAAALGTRPPPGPPVSEPTVGPALRRWAPLFYSAAAVVGMTAVVAYMTRK